MTNWLRIIALMVLLEALGSQWLNGQSSSIGLRLGRFYVSQSERIELEGAPIVFSNWASSGFDSRSSRFAIGGFYETSRKSDFYQRFIFQYEVNRANQGSTWNLIHNETITLDLRVSTPSFTGAFSTGRFWNIKRLRFAFGLEAGMTFAPAYEQSELYTFFDSLGMKQGLVSFNTSEPASYQPYLKWFGSGYYRFSKRFAVGIELAYGLEGYHSKGTKSVTRIDRDPAGNTLNTSMENTDVKFFYVNLPARLNLPYIGITYLFGQKSDEQGVDREVVNR
jgi:hypothetical protein